MKHSRLIIFTFWTTSLIIISLVAVEVKMDAAGAEAALQQPDPLSKAINSFAIDLYQQLVRKQQNDTTNMIFSPLSISTCLSMVMLGARNRSESQLFEGLKFKGSFGQPLEVHSSFRSVNK